jgi:hypothetical protein
MQTAFPSRRRFLKTTAATGALLGACDLGFLASLPSVSAAESKLDARFVRFSPEIEPLVRLLEETPRERLLEEVGQRVRYGLAYRDVLAALQLAGVRNIQPRPVGFKFHAVLVINSAHLASMNSPDSDRWLPIFWALDQFKSSQARNKQEGDWHMPALDEAALPSAGKARAAFIEAMDNWDAPGVDAAVASLARSAGVQEVFELFARYGARDFRDIGHKAIYVANGFRTLQNIGWHHAEPVLRSLGYALLDAGGNTNPAKNDHAADRPGRRNEKLVPQIRADWRAGKPDAAATVEMLTTLRQGSDEDASAKVVQLLNRGVAAQSLTDAFFHFAGELLMKKPNIQSLHSVTSANALHYAFTQSGNDETRRFLLLQQAAFLVLFRGNVLGQGAKSEPLIEKFEPEPPKSSGLEAVAEIFADATKDKMLAARKALAWLTASGQPKPFVDAAQRLIYLKGTDSHDYKFSSAVLEDYRSLTPAMRDRYLAASLFYLKGSGAPDTGLVKRTRAALAG